MNPYRAKAKASHAAKIKGYASGGRVPEDIAESEPKMMKGTEGKGYAGGGMVMGMKAPKKAHKAKKAGTHINIINMPHGGAGAPPPGPGPGVGMIPPPVRPVAPAPMPGPMGMPPPGVGPGPMMRKNGGAVKAFAKGGAVGEVDKVSKANPLRKPTGSADPVSKAEPIAKPDKLVKGLGAKAPSSEKKPDPVSKAEPTTKMGPLGMRASATNGVGGLEKIKAYGKNVGKTAKSSSTS